MQSKIWGPVRRTECHIKKAERQSEPFVKSLQCTFRVICSLGPQPLAQDKSAD